jgi:transcriptional regulator with XRE-family HTH domain
VTRPEELLGTCLRDLRSGHALTQKDVARALGVSVPLLSSWENGNATPPQARLDSYARLFALDPPVPGIRPSLPAVGALTGPEGVRYETLLRELTRLRGGGAAEPPPPHPLRFPPGQPITVVCSELPDRLRSAIGYSDARTPDYVESYKYADLDALIELLPHLGALNPDSEITTQVSSMLSDDDLPAHLIALGGVDFNPLMRDALERLKQVPVQHLGREDDQDPGGFNVRRDTDGEQMPVRPLLVNDRLKQDVAHFLRAPNPFHPERTITLFGGMYSRGSVGVVRALTDAKVGDRNAGYLARRFDGADTYSIVSRVEIVANQVIVPDWTRPENRLHEWPPAFA